MFSRLEYRAIDKIDVAFGPGSDRIEQRISICKPYVCQLDVRLDRYCQYGQTKDVAQGAVRVRQAVEEVAVFVIRCAALSLLLTIFPYIGEDLGEGLGEGFIAPA